MTTIELLITIEPAVSQKQPSLENDALPVVAGCDLGDRVLELAD